MYLLASTCICGVVKLLIKVRKCTLKQIIDLCLVMLKQTLGTFYKGLFSEIFAKAWDLHIAPLGRAVSTLWVVMVFELYENEVRRHLPRKGILKRVPCVLLEPPSIYKTQPQLTYPCKFLSLFPKCLGQNLWS